VWRVRGIDDDQWHFALAASAKLELVDQFCYLGDMLSVDGDADAAADARIRIGWNKFRQLVPLLTNKDQWHFGQTTLIDDRLSRLVFQLSGDGVRAAVDDIRVSDGECPLDRSQYDTNHWLIELRSHRVN